MLYVLNNPFAIIKFENGEFKSIYLIKSLFFFKIFAKIRPELDPE